MNTSGVCTICLERCSKESIGCQCIKFKRIYHLNCSQITSHYSKELAKKWICESCEFQAKLKKLLETQEEAIKSQGESIKKIPETIAKEVTSQISKMKLGLEKDYEQIKTKVISLEGDLHRVDEDSRFIQTIECKRDIIISGIPSSISEPKALRDIVLKIGTVYNIVVRPEDIFQCVRLKRHNQVMVKFGNVFIKDDIMAAYFKTTNLKLHHIMATNIESRVFMNNNYPKPIQRVMFYCQRLKKLNLISKYVVNFTSGKIMITGNDNTTASYANFEELSLKHKMPTAQRTGSE